MAGAGFGWPGGVSEIGFVVIWQRDIKNKILF
jgi:hypothetical protein